MYKMILPHKQKGLHFEIGFFQASARKLPVIPRHLYDCSDGTLKVFLPLYGVMNKDTMLPLMKLLTLEMDQVLFGKL